MSADIDELMNEGFEKAPMQGMPGLPDGKYVLAFKEAELKEKNGGIVILSRSATVIGGEKDGHEVSWDTWLVGKDGVDKDKIAQVRKELETLGFDVENWTRDNNRPFTSELKKALVAMVGMRFEGNKKSNKNANGKVYHNLYIDARDKSDGKPEKLGQEEIESVVKQSIPF